MAYKSSLWDSISMVWCGLMWHIFPRGDHMEKYKEEPRTCHRKPREEKKKKKTKEPRTSEKPRQRAAWVFFIQLRAAQVACDLGRAQRNPSSARPGSRVTWVAPCLGFFHPSCARPRQRPAQVAHDPSSAPPRSPHIISGWWSGIRSV